MPLAITTSSPGCLGRRTSWTPSKWTAQIESCDLPRTVVKHLLAIDPRDALTRAMTTEVSFSSGVSNLLGELLPLSPSDLQQVPANGDTCAQMSDAAAGLKVLAWAVPDIGDFDHRIEWRLWYVDGKYLGDNSPWKEDVAGAAIAKLLTGDFYGEWQGTRHVDGAAVVADFVRREKELRATGASNHPPGDSAGDWYHVGERTSGPIKLSDWGELRIVTWPLPACPASDGSAGGAS